jgi:type II secretory pathway pseudopilin PulG
MVRESAHRRGTRGAGRKIRLPARGESGFTLVGVVVAIAILTILIAAVGPSIATILERDRETELIFRGKQYARAILAFQKRYGRYPMELKEMFKNRPRTIRKLWTDPMCNCDDWDVIIAGTPEAVPMGSGITIPGGSGPRGVPGLETTPPPGNRPPSTYSGLLQPTAPPFLGGGAGPRTPTPPSIFGSSEQKKVGPIVGVRSKVRRKAVKEWRGRAYTDEWRFIVGDADNENSAQWFNPDTLRGPHFTPSPQAGPQ